MTSAIYLSHEDFRTRVPGGEHDLYPILADRCLMKPFAPGGSVETDSAYVGNRGGIPYVPTVLIVDDEKDIRDLLKTTIEKHHYAAVEAATGSECRDPETVT